MQAVQTTFELHAKRQFKKFDLFCTSLVGVFLFHCTLEFLTWNVLFVLFPRMKKMMQWWYAFTKIGKKEALVRRYLNTTLSVSSNFLSSAVLSIISSYCIYLHWVSWNWFRIRVCLLMLGIKIRNILSSGQYWCTFIFCFSSIFSF